MAIFNRSVPIIPQHAGIRQKIEILVPFGDQLLNDLAHHVALLGRLVVIMAVLCQHERGIRSRLSQFSNKRFNPLRNMAHIHVPQAVHHIDGRIKFRDQLRHFDFHLAIAADSQIHHRYIQFTPNHRDRRQSRPGGVPSLGDRGSVENNTRRKIPGRKLCKRLALGDPDFKTVQNSVGRQVQLVFLTLRQIKAGGIHEFLGGEGPEIRVRVTELTRLLIPIIEVDPTGPNIRIMCEVVLFI